MTSGLVRIATLVRNAWTVAGAILITLVAIELVSSLVLGVFGPRTDQHDPRARADAYGDATWTDAYFGEFEASARVRWEPYVYWRRLEYHGQHINVDSDGIRSTWQGDSGSTVMTVFVFGGSTVWGTGARDDFTIPSLLAKQLSARGIRARVVNYGESGYVTTQELIGLERLLHQGLRPDVVIFYDGINDPFPAMQMKVAGIPQNEFNRIREFNVLHPDRRSDLLAEVFSLSLRQTSTYRFASDAIRRLSAGSQEATKGRSTGALPSSLSLTLVEDVVRVYRTNVRFIEALSRSYDFQAEFFLQPAVFTKQRLTTYERARLDEVAGTIPDYSRVYQALRSDPDLAGNPHFHEISDVFGQDARPHFIDPWHLSEEGNAVIAARMLASVSGQ